MKQVAHDGPEHISSHSAIEEMTRGHSFRILLYIRVLFQVTCTCAFLTTLLALMFNSQSSGKLLGRWSMVAHPKQAIEEQDIVGEGVGLRRGQAPAGEKT